MFHPLLPAQLSRGRTDQISTKRPWSAKVLGFQGFRGAAAAHQRYIPFRLACVVASMSMPGDSESAVMGTSSFIASSSCAATTSQTRRVESMAAERSHLQDGRNQGLEAGRLIESGRRLHGAIKSVYSRMTPAGFIRSRRCCTRPRSACFQSVTSRFGIA